MSVDTLLSYAADGARGADVDRKMVNIQDPGPAGAAREMLIPDFPPIPTREAVQKRQSKF